MSQAPRMAEPTSREPDELLPILAARTGNVWVVIEDE